MPEDVLDKDEAVDPSFDLDSNMKSDFDNIEENLWKVGFSPRQRR